MDVVIRLGVRIEMHRPLFSIGTLKLNTSRFGVIGEQMGHYSAVSIPVTIVIVSLSLVLN